MIRRETPEFTDSDMWPPNSADINPTDLRRDAETSLPDANTGRGRACGRD